MNDVIKTLLYCYPSFIDVIKATDKLVYYKAITSYKDNSKTCAQMNEIVLLNERSARLVWIKGVIDQLLAELTPYERQLVEYKYFHIMQDENFDSSARSYFRKQLKLEKKIEKLMDYLKPDENWFYENLGDIYFLRAKYQRIKKMAETCRKNSAKERNL